MVRFPHTATISWKVSTKNESTGRFTDGPEQKITVEGRFEPETRSTKANDGSRLVDVSYKFFSNLILETIPIGAIIEGNGIRMKILQIFNSQISTVIWL